MTIYRRLQLYAGVVLTIIGMLVVGGAVAMTQISNKLDVTNEYTMNSIIKTWLSNSVNSMANVLSNKDHDEIISILKDVTYGDDRSGYYFVYNKTTVVSYNIRPDLQGTNLDHIKDLDGIYVIRELYMLSRSGGGYLEYTWDTPDKGQTKKISYVTQIPGTDYWIGSGVYLDNVDAIMSTIALERRSYIKHYSIILIVGLMLIIGLIWIPIHIKLVKSIIHPINLVKDVARKASIGDIAFDIDYTSDDEVGDMMKSFEHMVVYINRNIEIINEISKGNLDVDVIINSDRDILGYRLQDMVNNLKQLIYTIQQNSLQLQSGSNDLSSMSQSLAESSESLAMNASNTNASVSQLIDISLKTKEQVESSLDLADKQTQSTTLGVELLDRLSESMEDIKVKSDDMRSIIKTIDDIAFQTNILALNAAVEAARAGASGKGFAVVAGEVRDLATKSATASNSVGELITSELSSINDGIDMLKDVNMQFLKISEITDVSTATIKTIDRSFKEQSECIDDIKDIVVKIGDISSSNAAIAEESSASSEELSSQSDVMLSETNKFII